MTSVIESYSFKCRIPCAFNHHGFCCTNVCDKVKDIEQKLINELVDNYNPKKPLSHTNKAEYLLKLLNQIEERKKNK